MIIFLLLALNIYHPCSEIDTYMCLCDRDKCVSMCMHMRVAVLHIEWIMLEHTVDGLDTGVWGCRIYVGLDSKEAGDV